MATYAELMDALARADAAGDMEAVAEFQAMLRERDYEEESSMVESLAQGIGSGATFGFIDEIGAGVRAGVLDPIVSTLAGGDIGGVEGFKDYFTGMGERYDLALESQRDAMETARREDPWTTGIGEVVGGFGTGGAGMANLAGRATTTLGKLGVGAATGAGMGGLAGYGYSEGDPLRALAGALATGEVGDIEQEFSQAYGDVKAGAAIGGVLGGGLPVVGQGARALARFVARPFTRNARLQEEGRRRVVQAMAEDAQYMGFETEEEMLKWARRELQDTPGMTVADLGPALRELTEEVAQTPTAGGRQIRETLIDRNKEQWGRVFPALKEAFGVDDQFSTARKKLLEEMRGRADRHYTAGHAITQRVTPRMRAIMQTDEFAEALTTANALRRLTPQDKGGPLPEISLDDLRNLTQMTGRDLDYIIQGMDDVVGDAFKNRPAVARRLKELREEFKGAVFQNNSSLKEARAVWAGDQATNDAFDMGLRVLRDDADVTADIVRGFGSESERIAFLTGALRAFTRKLGAKPETGDLTTIFGSRNAKEALSAALGGGAKFRDFIKFIEGEQKLFGTFHQAVGNSATARRLKQTPDVFGKLAALFGYTGALASGTGAPPAIVGYGARRAYETIAPQGRRLAAERITRGQQAQGLLGGAEQLDDLMRPISLGGLLDTGVPVSAQMATGGLLGTGLPQPGVDYGAM